jgi:hypothetical protein
MAIGEASPGPGPGPGPRPRPARERGRRRTVSQVVTAVVLLGLVVAATGCTRGAARTSSTAGSLTGDGGSGQAAATAAPGFAEAPAAKDAPGQSLKAAATATLQHRDVVRTGAVSLRVGDVDQAADAVLTRAARHGGRVDGDTRADTGQQRTATLVLRVPPADLSAVLTEVDSLGEETSRKITGEDVTTARADVEARVRALTTSIGRLRTFLQHSGSINDLVALESQLSQREADLESTRAQQKALVDQIDLATLTVSLSARPRTAAHGGHGPAGFLGALAGGWHGLTLGWRWLAAGVGYVLPFVLLIGVLAWPASRLWRRLRNRPVVHQPVATP